MSYVPWVIMVFWTSEEGKKQSATMKESSAAENRDGRLFHNVSLVHVRFTWSSNQLRNRLFLFLFLLCLSLVPLRYYENALKEKERDCGTWNREKKKTKERNRADVCAIRDSTLYHLLFLSSTKDFRWNLSNLHNAVCYIYLCLHLYPVS